MVDDERSTVLGEDVLEKAMEEDVSIDILQHFAVVPGCGPDKTVIRPLVPPVEEVASEPVLHASQRTDTLYDVFHRDPLA